MEQTILTTTQVAGRYYELAREGKWADIWEELFDKNVVNIEPEHVASRGVPVVSKGLDVLLAKSAARREGIETIHSHFCSEPIVAGNFFSVTMGQDLTFKGQPRMNLQEVAVLGVKEGKIISEQFFY